MSIKVDSEKCTGCGTCVDSCPYGAIVIEDGLAKIGDNCTLCGTCAQNCQTEAISIELSEEKQAEDLDTYEGVFIFAEQRRGKIHPVSFELLGIGKNLADQLGTNLSAILLGCGIGHLADELGAHGADRVFLAEHENLDHFSDDAYGNVVTDIVRAQRPQILLAGATAIGRSFIPRVATSLGVGLTADCTELAIRSSDKLLLQTRPAFGGNVMATIVCPNSRPQMATVRPKVMKKPNCLPGRKAEIIPVSLDSERTRPRVKLLGTVEENVGSVNLTEADVIITGGRGLKNSDNFEMLKDLADQLGGAVAGTRVAVDEGWLPYARQIGQTGKTVSPKLYIACGVSGAVQHIVGMQSSDIIVAINNDSHAPIFSIATYGMVGDLFEIVPALIKRLKETACK